MFMLPKSIIVSMEMEIFQLKWLGSKIQDFEGLLEMYLEILYLGSRSFQLKRCRSIEMAGIQDFSGSWNPTSWLLSISI